MHASIYLWFQCLIFSYFAYFKSITTKFMFTNIRLSHVLRSTCVMEAMTLSMISNRSFSLLTKQSWLIQWLKKLLHLPRSRSFSIFMFTTALLFVHLTRGFRLNGANICCTPSFFHQRWCVQSINIHHQQLWRVSFMK